MTAEPNPKTSETELGAIRAIVFDTFGTIVDWRTSLIKALEEFGRKTDVETAWDHLVDRWRAAYKPNLDRVRTGELKWTILDELHYSALVAGIWPYLTERIRFTFPDELLAPLGAVA